MASITINAVTNVVKATSEVTGEEKILIINKGGKPSTIGVNQILNKIDDDIIDRIDDPILEIVESQIEDMIEDRLENVDPTNNLNWNEVL